MMSSLLSRVVLTHSSAFAGSSTSSMVCMTNSLAPPCSGPFSAPIAPVIAEYTSERVEVITRLVKVEALKECSA